MTCPVDPEYVFVILVNGNISSDGYFPEVEEPEANRISKRYVDNYTVKVKRIKKHQGIT